MLKKHKKVYGGSKRYASDKPIAYRQKLVAESIVNFERNKDPKEAMNIGSYRRLKKGDRIKVYNFLADDYWNGTLTRDETVLDNSPHEAKCILNNALYPAYWEEWMNASNAKPIPGALEFLKYAETKGVEVFYITNRNDRYRTQTLKNLQDLNFPFAENDHLLMKTDESSKKSRRDLVSKTRKIILFLGDNLNDFSEVFEKKTVPERFEITDNMQNEFGKHFIVLPNAMYGEWEGALYEYDYTISGEEKNKLRHKYLQSF